MTDQPIEGEVSEDMLVEALQNYDSGPQKEIKEDTGESVEASQNNPEPDEQPKEDSDGNDSEDETEEEGEEPEDEEESEDDDAEDEEAEDDEEEEEQPTEITLKDGTKLTVEEIESSYFRLADYTQKTQQLASYKKSIEGELDNYKQQYVAAIDNVAGVLESLVNDTSLDKQIAEAEAIEDFGLAASLKLQKREQQETLQRVKAEQANAQEHTRKRQLQQFQEYVGQEDAKLVGKIPGWEEPGQKSEIKGKLAKYLSDFGYNENELATLADSRALQLAYKAMQLDEMDAQKSKIAKKIENKPRVIKSKARRSKGEVRQQKRIASLKQYEATGNDEILASLLNY